MILKVGVCLAALAALLQADTPDLQVRLKTRLTSYDSKPGDHFQCVVLRSWIANGSVIIPAGAIVHGHVGRVTTVGLGVRHERASMELVFEDFVTGDGRDFALHAKLAAVDNAREQINSKGAVRGVLAARQPNKLVFGMWSEPSLPTFSRTLIGVTGVSNQISSALEFGPVGTGGMLVLRLAFFPFPEPEIQYGPGVELRLRVDAARQQGVSEAPRPPLAAPEQVEQWLLKEPFGVRRRDKRLVSDIVNVAFLGSREQLARSFEGAGWSKADAASGTARKNAYVAFNSMRAYATAPVSALFYKGMLPELVFEKSLNTVSKRHHIRVWYAGVVDGKELWLGAATHDTGAVFKIRSFKFTHKIDPNIDDERDKVATDLSFAGCAQPEMLVDRPAAAANESDHITDGAVSVLSLADCERPAAPDDGGGRKPGTKGSRLLRRMILEARHHFFRDNPYYWTAQLVKYSLTRGNQAAAVR